MRPLARFAAVALAAFAFVLAGTAAADGWKNLQVLPRTMSKDELKALMKAQSRALGVECDHCHDMPEADKDTKNKKIAREMMKMQNEINSKFMKSMERRVTCDTCHRGKEKPEVTGAK